MTGAVFMPLATSAASKQAECNSKHFKVGASTPRRPSGLGFLKPIIETYGCNDFSNDLL
jgi:hypothetical protein